MNIKLKKKVTAVCEVHN